MTQRYNRPPRTGNALRVDPPTPRLINRLLRLRNRHFLGLDVLLLTLSSPWLAFLVRTDGLNTQLAGWYALSRYTFGLAVYTLVALAVWSVVPLCPALTAAAGAVLYLMR